VAPKAELSGASATRASYAGPLAAFAPYGGRSITGSASHPDAANNALLPNLYAMWSVTKDFKLGLSVNAPFGLVTEYDANFIGRYHALKSDLKTVDVALNAAYRLHPAFSVGGSVIYRKVDTELTNAVDFGQIAFLGLAQLGNAAYTSFVPSSTAALFDGKATIKGGANVIGYKLGIVFEPTTTFRAGLSYHGATTVKVDGTVDYDYPVISTGTPSIDTALTGALTAVATGGKLVDGSATAEVELPDTTSLGLSWDVTPTVNLAFEASRTGWSKFKELRVKFGSGQADSVTDENWRNTMYYALGATWKATNALTLRAGLAMDQGAVEDSYLTPTIPAGASTFGAPWNVYLQSNRTPRIPDGDRTWYSAGLSYAFSKSIGVDFAFTHITVKDGLLALQAGAYGNQNFFRGNLSGTYKSSIDIVAVSARYNF
jgi:long-chain fatty acid transport protein